MIVGHSVDHIIVVFVLNFRALEAMFYGMYVLRSYYGSIISLLFDRPISVYTARAIENQCYVLAAAQYGKHNGKRDSFGHSLVSYGESGMI